MFLSFSCPKCQTVLEADAAKSGTAVSCTECGSDVPVPNRFIGPGVTIGGFRIKKLIGRGGMGEVYLATQLSLQRDVALKILPVQFTLQKSLVERFLREVRMAARLQHPNIVTAYAAGEDDGVYYMAMAYVKGETLEERLRREGEQEEQESLRLIRTIAVALDFAWKDHHLLHRDIKPANIMIDSRQQAKLLDMGLSKSLDDMAGVTQVAMVMGTPNYVSPEQAEGREDIDFRSDMYSLGSTLYHMLTAKMPFEGSTMADTLRKQVTEALPDPRDLNENISEPCVELLAMFLAKDPDRRHLDWESMVEDIDRVLAGESPACQPTKDGKSALLARGVSLQDVGHPDASQRIVLSHDDAERLHDAGRVIHDLQHQKGRQHLGLIVGICVGAVLLLGLTVGVLRHQGRGKPLPPDDPPPPAATNLPPVAVTNAPPVPPENPDIPPQKERQTAVENKLRDTLAFAADHPEDYSGAVQQFQETLMLAEQTPLEEQVREAMRNYEDQRQERIDDALSTLFRTADEQYRDGDASLSVSMLTEYAGPFAVETVEARRLLSERFQVRVEAYRQEQLQAQQVMQAHLRQAVEEVANLVLRRQYDEAAAQLEALGSREEFEPLRTTRDQAVALLENTLSLPDLVFQSFHDDIGKTLVIYFRTGPEELRITDVKTVQIWADKRIQLSGGNVASSQRRFTVDHLSAREKARRVGRDTQPASDLMLGLLALEMKDVSLSLRYFDRAEHLPGEVFSGLVRQAYDVPDVPEGAMGDGTAEPGVVPPAPDTPPPPGPADEEAARRALTSLFTVASIRVAEEDMDALVETSRRKTFGRAVVNSVRQQVGAFKEQFADTETAETYQPVLDILGRIVPDRPLFVTEDTVDAALDHLQRDNPDIKQFTAQRTLHPYGVDLDLKAMLALRNLEALRDLPVIKLDLSTTGVRDLSPLSGMPLEDLNLSRIQELTDLSPLEGLSLRALNVSLCPLLKDIRALRGMPLKWLDLSSTKVADLRDVQGMALEALRAQGLIGLSDLRPLTGSPIEKLRVNGSPISNFNPISTMPNLKDIRIDSGAANGKVTLEPFLACPSLTTLSGNHYLLARLVESNEFREGIERKQFSQADRRLDQQLTLLKGKKAFEPWMEHLTRIQELMLPMTRDLLEARLAPGAIFIPDTALNYHGHSYAVCLLPMKWKAAQTYAETFGGYLACPSTKEEYDWFKKTFYLAGRALWMGASDERVEGTWRWVSGEAFDFNDWPLNQTAPDNRDDVQHWLFLRGDTGQWDDVNGDQYTMPFVIEWDR